MANPVDYNMEREENIIKNIAKEIVIEASQKGTDVPKELANYLVKLKLLNPKNGFTASEVMPRNLTQQLVTSVLEDLKQDTPAMNCIRMQAYWNSVNLDVEELKREYQADVNEKAEAFLNEIINPEEDEANKIPKAVANYILFWQNLGNPNNVVTLKETLAALHSVFRTKDAIQFVEYPEEQKIEFLKALAKKVTGIRVFLKSVGRGNEGIRDVSSLLTVIEICKEDVQRFTEKVSERVGEVREAISSVVAAEYFFGEGVSTAEVFLPPDCDLNDLKYLKQVLAIMLQHSVYLSDLLSKLEEIDGNSNVILKEFEETLLKIQGTVREREAVPTVEVFDDFIKIGTLWSEIQSYFYTVENVQGTIRTLEGMNSKEHFNQTQLEKIVSAAQKYQGDVRKKSTDSKSVVPSSLQLSAQEDFHLEFRGFCAWTLYFTEGYLVSGAPSAGVYHHNDQNLAFSSKLAHEMWAKDPHHYLMSIYEYLRHNPELVELLNAYDNLYGIKSLQLIKKVDRKISTRTAEMQTELHPVEKLWDKDYTFSEWELKKRALTLSRLVKCVTKSAQTVGHSHYRASVGLLAAPDKDKEVQTKRDDSCGHSAIANYLYGLRGHREDKFRVIELTRPVEETCEREIVLERGDPCRDRRRPAAPPRLPYADPACPPWAVPEDECKYFVDHATESSCEYSGEGCP